MEAKNFGFGLDMPPAFKFDPTDADIVAHYLLPRALGLPNPHDHAIIKDFDPGKVPPWDILHRAAAENHAVHAFFFCPATDASKNGGRKSRTVKGGGVWQGQKGTEETITLLGPAGDEVDIRYKRYNLTFIHLGRPSGYVMHEYVILEPPLPATVLTRIKLKAKKNVVDAQHAVPQLPNQTDLRYDYHAAADGEGFAGAQDGALYDSNGYYHGHTPLQYDLPVCEYDNNNYYNAAEMMDDGEGFTGAQADAFYGGGTVETAGDYYYDPSNYVPQCGGAYDNNCYNAAEIMSKGKRFTGAQADAFCGGEIAETAGEYYDASSNYVPECAGEYSDYYGEYQQGASNQYQAEDAAGMSTGGDGFIGEQQAAAHRGNSGKGCVAHSTDDITFYNNYDPSNNVPECGGEYNYSYGEYEQRQYQQDPSNCQCQAGDAAVMCAEGVVAAEQQTGAICGNIDSGIVVGRETTRHSTIPFCSDHEEYKCDDNTFYNILFDTGHEDDFNCDHNDAGDPANVLDSSRARHKRVRPNAI
ncbi:hypothetical protein ACQ4PT_054275 [Festuca glaucescens]